MTRIDTIWLVAVLKLMQISTALYSHIVSNSHELCSDCAGYQCFPGQDSSLVLHLCGRRLGKPAQVIRWRYSTGNVRLCEVFGIGSCLYWCFWLTFASCIQFVLYNVFPISRTARTFLYWRMCDAPDIIWTPLNANSVAGVACFSVIWVVVCGRDMSQCFWHISGTVWHSFTVLHSTEHWTGQKRSTVAQLFEILRKNVPWHCSNTLIVLEKWCKCSFRLRSSLYKLQDTVARLFQKLDCYVTWCK